jgi:acetyl-CoA C-acetyltransferase
VLSNSSLPQVHDGLTCAFNDYHMGITAENIAKKYSLTRQEQDQFAFNSQLKARNAQKEGRFKDQIVPIQVPDPAKGPKAPKVDFDSDE